MTVAASPHQPCVSAGPGGERVTLHAGRGRLHAALLGSASQVPIAVVPLIDFDRLTRAAVGTNHFREVIQTPWALAAGQSSGRCRRRIEIFVRRCPREYRGYA